MVKKSKGPFDSDLWSYDFAGFLDSERRCRGLDPWDSCLHLRWESHGKAKIASHSQQCTGLVFTIFQSGWFSKMSLQLEVFLQTKMNIIKNQGHLFLIITCMIPINDQMIWIRTESLSKTHTVQCSVSSAALFEKWRL